MYKEYGRLEHYNPEIKISRRQVRNIYEKQNDIKIMIVNNWFILKLMQNNYQQNLKCDEPNKLWQYMAWLFNKIN